MATLTVRKLDDATYARLGERARRNRRSLEAEVRAILEEKTRAFNLEHWLEEVHDLRERSQALPDGMTSLDLLRQERESW